VYERLATMTDLTEVLTEAGRAFAGWALDNPAYAQLMIWRPVPGYQPTPEAYEPAIAVSDAGRAAFADMRRRGLIRGDIDTDTVYRDWTVLISGVISQQLANQPEATFADGRFTSAMPRLAAMFSSHYAPATRTGRAPRRGRNVPAR
jgi:hypothetical protein